MNRDNDFSETDNESPANGPSAKHLPLTLTEAPYLATMSQADATPSDAHVPAFVGTAPSPPGYTILRELGRGGMGVVYEATDTRLKRQVALKMLLATRRDGQSLIRFLIEAEAMAQVRHPHVVQVFEAGENGGHPFLALEYLSGGTLSDRIVERKLALDEAISFMVKITRGVEAAHRLGIVHRDLKPSNIMFDEAGEPKVTDFGLAKRGEKDLTATEATMGTPAYMAPEQAKGESKSAGPAADVYALGVMLYELTTGERPFTGDTPATIVYQVIHDTPALPRHRDPAIPRDIEVITLKCLEKDPRARYADAGQLADDLQRFLDNEPISARPITRLERGRKWIRRNPLVAASMAVAVFALFAGSGVSYWKYLDAAEQRKLADQKREEAEGLRTVAEQKQIEAEQQRVVSEQRRLDAEQQSETARAMSEFLGGLFDDANPLARTSRAFGVQNRNAQNLTALQVVDRGAAKLKSALLDRPRIRAALLDRIGNVYIDLGRSREAMPLLEEALAIRRKEYGNVHWEIAGSLNSVGLLYSSLGQYDLAFEFLGQALEIRRRLLGANHYLVADTLFHLGIVRVATNDYSAATKLFEECFEIRRQWYQPVSYELAATLFLLAFTQLESDQLKAAGHLQAAAAISDKINGNNDLSDVINLFFQGQVAQRLGNNNKAREIYAKAEPLAIKALGEDSFIISVTRGVYADFLREIGEAEESARIFRKVVEGFRKSFGNDSLNLASKLKLLARAERSVNRNKEAQEAEEEADRIYAMHAAKKKK